MTRTMPRIVFCYRYGLLGGVSAQLLNRLPHLARDFDVRVVFEQDHGMVSRFPRGVAAVARSAQDKEEALREAKPDVTVVIDSPSFVEAWSAAGSCGKLMLEVHTTTANLSYIDEPARLAAVSRIVTVSEYMEDLLRQRQLDSVAPITIIPNCLDSRWREVLSTPTLDVKPALWVGKLDGHKRWRTALDVIERLCALPKVAVAPLLIGGVTAPEQEVRAITTRMANSIGLSRGVWWPRVEYGKMPFIYSAVGSNGGVHICTSQNESFGMAVAESLVRECPVVAPRVGALPELLPAVALYDPGDWGEACAKAERALIDKEFRDELLSTADGVRKLTEPENAGSAYRRVIAELLADA